MDRMIANEVVGTGRMARLKSKVFSRVRSARSAVSRELRDNATKWSGIAAGAGLTLGLIARRMRGRRRIMPDIIIIEAR